MAAVYPTAVKTFSNRQNYTNIVDAGDVNQAYDEITSIQTVLGTSPNTDTVDGKVISFPTVKANISDVRRGLNTPVCIVKAANMKVPWAKEYFPAFTSRQVDTHNMWRGGPDLVCPRSGYYTVSAYIRWYKDGVPTANDATPFDHSGKLQLALSTGTGDGSIFSGETHYYPKGWQDLTRSSTSLTMYWQKGTSIRIALWNRVLQNSIMYATAHMTAVYHRETATLNNQYS